MKTDSLSRLKKKGWTQRESSSSSKPGPCALIHSPSHLACTGIIKVLYLCVYVCVCCSRLTFEHTRPTGNSTNKTPLTERKKKSIRHLYVCFSYLFIYISFSCPFRFHFSRVRRGWFISKLIGFNAAQTAEQTNATTVWKPTPTGRQHDGWRSN